MGQLKGILAITIGLVTAMPVAGQSGRKDIPFELHNGYLIVVKGSIGKLKNLSFVVDTGSYRSVLDEQIARKLHLKSAGSVEELAPNHIVQMDRVLVPELTWGNVTTTSFSPLVFDLSPILRHIGIHGDMLLGLRKLTPYFLGHVSPTQYDGVWFEKASAFLIEASYGRLLRTIDLLAM